ncbi:MAG: MarR family transcriptional regulator [Alistipes sp.]|jgi:DNA-binding MarR family transcriptional regulator|nr:MarR family transcriptional regulator [Alistipes sp.]
MKQLCKIRDLRRAVNRFEVDFENLYGIDLNEGMALCSIMTMERLAAGELGALLGLSGPNASKVIASVESKGLVERIIDPIDRRRMMLTLTPKGQGLITSIDCTTVGIPQELL